MNDLLILVLIVAIGFVCQWLAWRAKLPAIVFLLLAGLALGPMTGVLDPDQLFGGHLFPVVSLAVAVILFEGSMTLRLSELREIRSAVRGLVSYGAVITWLLLAAAAHFIARLDWGLALLFGALTCVTGPTVIAPMLRTLRPNANVANVLRWEGIIIDPIGALFAVLVFEAIVSREQGHSVWVFLYTIAAGLAIGAAGAFVLAFLLRRQLLPEYLHIYGTLALLVTAFGLSNALAHESGLLAVTVMGMVVGNLRGVAIDHILHFKESLTLLLVSMLFIVLAARMVWPVPAGLAISALLVLLAAQFIVRPISVFVSTIGSRLSWRERALIAYVAPRGIVAAAVSALFAIKLEAIGYKGAEILVPLVFALIIGTVVLQSLTAGPLARLLGVAEPEASGVLVYGADPVALAVAKALDSAKIRVRVADHDWSGISQARMMGMETYFGSPSSLHAETHLDLSGIGRLMAMSPVPEQNALAAQYYRSEFGIENVYELRSIHRRTARDPANPEASAREALADSLQVPALFGSDVTRAVLARRLDEGWAPKTTRLSESFDWAQFVKRNGGEPVLLFAVDGDGQLQIPTSRRRIEPERNWTVTALVPARPDAGDEGGRNGDEPIHDAGSHRREPSLSA